MGFWSLFEVASTPVLQFLLVGLLGAFLASGYSTILSAGARRDINKVVFVVFTPSIMFSTLAENVTLRDLISWWYMPVNIAITFLIGGFLGWAAVKILRPERHLEGLVIANCSAGNLGNLLYIIVPAICNEKGNPFGEASICHAHGLSYVSLSMALGGIFIWTHTYSLMRKSGALYDEFRNAAILNMDSRVSDEAHLIKIQGEDGSNSQEAFIRLPIKPADEVEEHENTVPLLSSSKLSGSTMGMWDKLKGALHQLVEELLAPPTIAAIVGLIVGVIPWLKSLIIGASAPLRVIQDSITLLGDGMLPCITLILGGNLTQGFRKSALKPLVVIVIVIVRYVILPICGIGVVKAAYTLGFLPEDPLFRYVLLIQFTLPPAMNIGTMAQLFDVAKEECSVIFLWTYVAATLALTIWSTVFMWLLS